MMNDPRFEAGLAALVDLYLHSARIAGGQDRIFSNPAKGEAAAFFVTSYQKRVMDAGPQPSRPAGVVTNFYDEPRPETLAPTEPAPAAAPPVVVGDETPASQGPPSIDAVAALLNEDED